VANDTDLILTRLATSSQDDRHYESRDQNNATARCRRTEVVSDAATTTADGPVEHNGAHVRRG
jgi:hypothetical protein